MVSDLSSQSRKWKLLGIVLVIVIIIGGFGYWIIRPNQTNTITSIVTSTSESAYKTELSSSFSTTSPTEWIYIGAAKPVNYYFSLLESTKTEPYVTLAKELKKLPYLFNASAIAKITYLALNATNPEVKEAFELMIKGGTPDQRDFSYSVPQYNTELEVLYWLACQNEFKKDDTLVLAVAMVNGLWVSVGDKGVGAAVLRDSSLMLAFGRETSDWQRSRGLSYNLEEYPLEAKIAWAWTGNVTPVFGPFGLSDNLDSQNFMKKRLPFEGYSWNTVSVDTLRKMRTRMITPEAMLPPLEAPGQVIFDVSPIVTMHNLEYYFYFMNDRIYGPSSEHWDYADLRWDNTSRYISLDGKVVKNYLIFNIDAMFREHYMRNGKLTGGCADETAWIDAWAKSVGISTTALWRVGWDKDYHINRYSHMFSVFYDPLASRWTADNLQLGIGRGSGERYQLTNIFKPPVNQHDYLRTKWYDNHFMITGNFFHTIYDLTNEEIANTWSVGVSTAAVKQWLLYS